MPNADCECNSQQARNEKGLKVRTCGQFGEIGSKMPVPPGRVGAESGKTD
jgi:hypothetical protein